MSDIDTALVEQILNIAKGPQETNVQHHCQTGKHTGRYEMPEWIGFGRLKTQQI
jgi:hypothetical protein